MPSGPELLDEYNRKRDFSVTPEPKGEVNPEISSAFRYVVQEHAARRLHYDLRLELDGVLKSWAVPKGPSLNPKEKRLAVATEDHPLSYATFEGEIPKGYGAGHMAIWDSGFWLPVGDPHRALAKGKLKFVLFGEKLKGVWNLVRTRGENNQWLLIKDNDETAEAGKVLTRERLTEDRSSKSSSKPSYRWRNRSESKPKSKAPIQPQLATLGQSLPTGDQWVHEIKYDGYRALCYCQGDKVRVITRGGADWTEKFNPIVEALQRMELNNTVLDGEIVAIDDSGKHSFQLLQGTLAGTKAGKLVYYIFDAPIIEGQLTTKKTLLERKRLLKELLAKAPDTIRYSKHIEEQGPQLLRQACETGLEGVISKRKDSTYEQRRSKSWVKSKCHLRQEFLVAGFTSPQGSRSHFGALLLAYHGEGGELCYAGKVGTGFDDKLLRSLYQKLKNLVSEESYLSHPEEVPDSSRVTWARPELIVEVEFTEWTEEGRIRHPSFIGERGDKEPAEIGREAAVAPEPKATHSALPVRRGVRRRSGKAEPLVIAGTEITNPDRVWFPEIGASKAEVISYYEAAAPRLLPFVQNRLLNLKRCPGGWREECFFQRHHTSGFPEAVKSLELSDDKKDYVYIDDVPGLIGLIQFGALELHPWASRIDEPEKPDQLTFDIDPSPEAGWSAVVDTAHQLKQIFDELRLECFVKTTGGKGLHVVLPLERRSSWQDIKDFSKSIAELMARGAPQLYTAKMSKASRKGKVFIDWFRNGRGHTSVAPYVVRAREGATISVPLSWSEVDKNLDPKSFNLKTYQDFLAAPDPWESYFEVRQSLKKELIKKLKKSTS